MPDTTLTFKCLGHTKRDDGLLGRYDLEVTDSRSGKTATISVEPRHLASARSMKRDPARSLYILVNQVVQT
ncbi:hypothetical protein WH299_15545 [Pseudomonas sp. MYb541]|uniref:hypothetical protein n=1 Tax=Pseudomonas sp. MYb541 TaxID=2745402 RepID=UPI00309AA067